MSDEETKPEAEPEDKKEETLSYIERAEKAAKDMEEQNKKMAQYLKQYEAEMTRNVLGGQSVLTKEPPKPDPKAELKQKTKDYWKGSSISKAVDKYVG